MLVISNYAEYFFDRIMLDLPYSTFSTLKWFKVEIGFADVEFMAENFLDV